MIKNISSGPGSVPVLYSGSVYPEQCLSLQVILPKLVEFTENFYTA